MCLEYAYSSPQFLSASLCASLSYHNADTHHRQPREGCVDFCLYTWVCKLLQRMRKSLLLLFVIAAGCSSVSFKLLWVVAREAKTSWQNTYQVELCGFYGFQLLTSPAAKLSTGFYMYNVYIYLYLLFFHKEGGNISEWKWNVADALTFLCEQLSSRHRFWCVLG